MGKRRFEIIILLTMLLLSCQVSPSGLKGDKTLDTLLLQRQDRLLKEAYIPHLKAKGEQYPSLLEFTLSPYWILPFCDDLELYNICKAEYDQEIAKLLPIDSTKEISVTEYLIDTASRINNLLTLDFETASVNQYASLLTLPPLPDGYYDSWNKNFPNNLLVISSPILNHSRTKGLIFEYRDDGDRICGNGKHWLIIFEQDEEGRWRIKEEKLLL